MKISLYFLLLYLCKIVKNNSFSMRCNGDEGLLEAAEADEVANRNKIRNLLRTNNCTVILDDYHLVTRHIVTDIYKFKSYRSVSVVFYPVRKDVSDARFTFRAEEVHLNNIGTCNPRDVVINLKHGSYPAVNPDGLKFPEHFVDPATRSTVHTVELQSDGKNTTYSIPNAQPGFWYALAYRKWEDPRTQKVEQQGLVADCHTALYTHLQVKIDDIRQIDCEQGIIVSYTNLPSTYKCMAVDDIQPISFNFTIINTKGAGEVVFLIQALYQPTTEDNLLSCYFDPIIDSVHSVNFIPHPDSWHYFTIDHYIPNNDTKINHCNLNQLRTEEDEHTNHEIIDLMRDNKGRFFTFDYGLPTTDLHDATSLVNLTSGEVKSLRFKITKILDIGGSLALGASLLMGLKYYMGYKREIKKSSQGSLLAFTEDDQFMRLVICMDIGHTSVPLPTGHCKYNNHVKPALFVLNTTDSDSIYDKVIIPFPEDGQWYLTFRLFCDEVVCPCLSTDNGTEYYVNVGGLEGVNGTRAGEWGNETRVGQSECNATVLLSISSSPCVDGGCTNNGSCLFNTFGGLIMSYCSCTSGYGGWDCGDDSRMDPRVSMIVSVLLLTLSNLLFIFTIYVAVIRQYYTEAVMYAFTMVFSTFYHACDAPPQVAYCITSPDILQFGDFYCGVMCFWVTLLAMSIMGDKLRGALQLIGAIIIALLDTWNMHSIVTFMLPVAFGVGFLALSWYFAWRKSRKLEYKISYYTMFLPIGVTLVAIGLVCFAWLQTAQNYKIVHSVWHMIIAGSVVFLLPDEKRGDDVNPFLPSPNFFSVFAFCSIFNRCQTDNRSQSPGTAQTDTGPTETAVQVN